MNSTYAELVRDAPVVRDTMAPSDDITQLVPSNDGDYIYALTGTQVSYSWNVSCTFCSPRLSGLFTSL